MKSIDQEEAEFQAAADSVDALMYLCIVSSKGDYLTAQEDFTMSLVTRLIRDGILDPKHKLKFISALASYAHGSICLDRIFHMDDRAELSRVMQTLKSKYEMFRRVQ